MTSNPPSPPSSAPPSPLATTPGATPAKGSRKGAHLPALDGIRGLAILMVLFHHAVYGAVAGGPLGRGLIRAAELGWLGVDLFFVLSGFLITGILLDSRDDPHFYRNFYMRRTLRIFPLYYAFLLVYLGLGPVLPLDRERMAEAVSYKWWLVFYLTNVLICLKGSFIVASINHLWTLAVEEHFYLIWPTLVRAFAPRLGLVCAAAVALGLGSRVAFLATGMWPPAPYVFTLCRADALALGGLLALVYRAPGGLGGLRVPLAWALAGGVAFVAAFAYEGSPLYSGRAIKSIGYTVTALGFVGLIGRVLLASPASTLGRVSLWGPLRTLGTYSYGLYVFHHPIRIVLQRLLPFERLGVLVHSYVAGLVLHGLLMFAISFAVAWASYHGFEKHFLKLKRFFEPARRAAPAPIEPA